MEFCDSIRRLSDIFHLESYGLELFMLYKLALISLQFMLLKEVYLRYYGEYSSHGAWCIV